MYIGKAKTVVLYKFEDALGVSRVFSGLGDLGFVFQCYWMLGVFLWTRRMGCFHGLCKVRGVSMDLFVRCVLIDLVVWGISRTYFSGEMN